MKKFSAAVLTILGVLAATGIAGAAVSGAALPKNEEPVLVTHVGQGAGEGQKILAQNGRNNGQRGGKRRNYIDRPQASDLANGGCKTMLVLVGSYAGGMTDVGAEVERLTALMEKAKAMGVKIVALHVDHEEKKGGKGKSPTLDLRCVDTVMKYADHAVVMKSGDTVNSRMTKLAGERKIPLSVVDSPRDLLPDRNVHSRTRYR